MKTLRNPGPADPCAASQSSSPLAKRGESFDPTFAEQCTPSYYNSEGKPDAKRLDRNFFIGGPTEFAEMLADWREDGAMRGLELREAGRVDRSARSRASRIV